MSCLACDILENPGKYPGGLIIRTGCWSIEHCIGPLGLGTLILKPLRHITSVADLNHDESAELGPLQQRIAAALRQLMNPEQIYVCLWSHKGGQPVHIHYVIQPVTEQMMAEHGFGPELQHNMMKAQKHPSKDEIEKFCGSFKTVFESLQDS